MYNWSLTLCLIFALNLSFAQTILWSEIEEADIPVNGKRVLFPDRYSTFRVDTTLLLELLDDAPLETEVVPDQSPQLLRLPLPNGEMVSFKIVQYKMMEEGLANRFPNIRTLRGVHIEDSRLTIRIDWTARGFRAMMGTPEGQVFIDPYCRRNTLDYLVYFKKDYTAQQEFTCEVSEQKVDNLFTDQASETRVVGDCQFREYRLAMATTGEYSNYHGANDATDAALVLAEVTTSINRVNEVYERDVSVRLTLIANTDDVFYYDGGTDPYTNNSGSTMLGENQTNLTSVIGSGNYDIGHVFSTGGGGIASLRSPCNNGSKARGVTGLPNPINDPFYIDYVAHEIGHQFGGNHTQNNSCNRAAAAAREPGSASTIMGYAGICNPNVQNSSDDYFHGYSIQEMADFVTNTSTGGSCPTIIFAGANTAPTTTNPGDHSIPTDTPFRLSTTGSDANDGTGSLTYCWEQWDNEVGEVMPPAGTNTQGPMFRTFDPTSEDTRYFPALSAVLAGSDPTWEELPTVSRNMEFRVTVRDNNSTYGCVGDQNVNITTTGTPFTVNAPNGNVNWTEGQYYLIEWVKGLTDQAPINCNTVNVLLASDGQNFNTTLASGIPNNGKAYVLLPSGTSANARLLVEAADNVFFNVNTGSIDIGASGADYGLGASPATRTNCPDQDATYTIQTSSFAGYSSNVSLTVSGVPSGASASIVPTSVTPGATATLTISGLQNVSAGTYTVTVQGTSASGTKDIPLELTRLDGPTAISVNAPVNNASDQSVNPTFDWPIEGFSTNYDIELASDPAFSAIVASTNTPQTNWSPGLELAPLTTYYWRVRGVGSCGSGPWSVANAFTTSPCFTFMSTDVPVTISDSGTPTVTSDLSIGASGTVNDVNVIDLIGTHTWMEDLDVSLISPAGTERFLFQDICGNTNDFDLELNSQAVSTNIPCPPTDGNAYRPEDSFDTFNGENITGTWTLQITDDFNQDGGELTSWGLRVCVSNYVAALPVTLIEFSATPEEDHIMLEWITGSEQDNKGFWIQRKLEGEREFRTIGWIDGMGTTSIAQYYSFEDGEAPRGVTCYYQLQQVDFDGKTDFSAIRSAYLEGDPDVVTIFPNPTSGVFFVRTNNTEDSGSIQVFSSQGQLIQQQQLMGLRTPIDLSDMEAGCYWIRVKQGDNTVVQKIIRQ